jgi:SsrA-binding protein
VVLRGTEVKSLRQKRVSIQEAYAKIIKNEIFVTGLTISHYENGNRFNHEPDRDRKLLLHRHEIKRLIGKLKEKGFTLIPLSLYFKTGKIKMELGLGKGKASYDKRRVIQQRDLDRDMKREMKRYA